jgi:hypothetical protein
MNLFLSGLLIFILLVGVNSYMSYRSRQKNRGSWKTFAASNNLDFVPNASWRGQPYVIGAYRGYQIQLKVIQKGMGRYSTPGTHIMLCKDWKSKPLQKKETSDQQLTLEEAIHQFTALDPRYPLMGKIDTIPGSHEVCYQQDGVETDVEQLQYLFDLLVNMADAYPKIMAAGGRAIPFLQKNAKLAIIRGNNSLRPITLQLVQQIAQDTMRLEHQISYLLCKHCLTRCCRHKVGLSPLDTITYYGCRMCSQSQEFVEWAGSVVAVLDDKMTTELSKEDGVLRVNWSVRRALFDFEGVEIIQATDEDVERFVVQVSNDTDELRPPRYRQMGCNVFPGCELSENTMRILRRTFGQVGVKQLTRE